MRGEKLALYLATSKTAGSPPHARGKAAVIGCHVTHLGITPACAGKSSLRRAAIGDPRDHPRMRGEKLFGDGSLSFAQGSPPHARGKDLDRGALGRLAGITPACAGKRWSSWLSPGQRRDHPRMRGEKLSRPPDMLSRRGSPPHARGKGSYLKRLKTSVGITPACAGKSSAIFAAVSACRDHPRMRGEKGQKALFRVANTGSPPHARGKAVHVCPGAAAAGITPACAGKSLEQGQGSVWR